MKVEESMATPVKVSKNVQTAAPAVKPTAGKKAVAEKAPAEKAEKKALEGLTQETISSKVITYRQGSGSYDATNLIAHPAVGFSKERFLKVANQLKSAGKAFSDCNPEAKWNKMSGIIKNLQKAGYKLPESTLKIATKA